MLLPAIVAVLALATVLGAFIFGTKTSELSKDHYKAKFCKMVAILTDLMYFVITVSAAQMMGCKKDVFGEKYLNAYPSLSPPPPLFEFFAYNIVLPLFQISLCRVQG